MSDSRRRSLALGGGLVGLGAGCLLDYVIFIFEKAHPMQQVFNNGNISSIYPNMAVTTLIVLVASLVAGFGLSVFGVALLNARDVASETSSSGPPPG